jgi:hypothetical protein
MESNPPIQSLNDGECALTVWKASISNKWVGELDDIYGNKRQHAKHCIVKSTVDWSNKANIILEYGRRYSMCLQAHEIFGSKPKSDEDTIECQSYYVETAVRKQNAIGWLGGCSDACGTNADLGYEWWTDALLEEARLKLLIKKSGVKESSWNKGCGGWEKMKQQVKAKRQM